MPLEEISRQCRGRAAQIATLHVCLWQKVNTKTSIGDLERVSAQERKELLANRTGRSLSEPLADLNLSGLDNRHRQESDTPCHQARAQSRGSHDLPSLT